MLLPAHVRLEDVALEEVPDARDAVALHADADAEEDPELVEVDRASICFFPVKI